MIKMVQLKSGFSDRESKDALQLMVESLAVRLNEGERKDFASQLPEVLQDTALTVMPTEDKLRTGLVDEFRQLQRISEARAKKQIYAAWDALKEALSDGLINHIRSQLPNQTVAFLH